MDLSNKNDSLDFSAIAEQAGKVAGAIKSSGIIKSVRDKAKAKKAQGISDSGGYFNLTAYQKSLIPVPDYAKTQAAASGNVVSGDSNQPVINDAGQVDVAQAPALPATDEQMGAKIKAYLPYIIAVIAIVVIVFFVIKRK